MNRHRGITPTMQLNLSPEERKKLYLSISPGISAADFDAIMAETKERQLRVPVVGSMAPDFELDVLDRQRKRTAKRVRLSDLRGRPVGLMFGSYT